MKELKNNKFLIIILIIFIAISIYLLYFYNNKNNLNDFYEKEEISLKQYEENEYIPVNITYDQIARIYLQDYVYKLLYDREDAYNTLDENYRNAKFTSFDEFNKYVDDFMLSMKLQQSVVKKYAITEKQDYKDFDVYDLTENLFIFRETGVMQYKVFFDRYTVKM